MVKKSNAAASNVVSHTGFATAPVKNPPMRKGPKPKGTLSFYAARNKQRHQRMREKEQRAEDAPPPGVRPEVSDDAVCHLVNVLKLLDISKLQRLVAEAERLVREYRAD